MAARRTAATLSVSRAAATLTVSRTAAGLTVSLAAIALITCLTATPAAAQDAPAPADSSAPADDSGSEDAPGPVDHLSHILEAWPETPEGRGLMAVAIEEGQIVSRHATMGLRSAGAGDLAATRDHAAHVIHAIDPSLVSDGPGLGFGLREAARAIELHIDLAAEHEMASEDIRAHAPTVSVSAGNAAEWAAEMVGIAEQIREAETAEAALPLARELWNRSVNIVSGRDLNGDDEIRWEDGEGGIMHVQMQMSLLRRSEGRWYTPRPQVNPGPMP